MTLRLTTKGQALLAGAQESVRHHLAGTLARFGTPELKALHKALGTLQESFPEPGCCRADGSGHDTLQGTNESGFESQVPANAAVSGP